MEKQKPVSLAEYRNRLENDIEISGTINEIGKAIDERVDSRLRLASVVFPAIDADENSPHQNATDVVVKEDANNEPDFKELEDRLEKVKSNAKRITDEELKMLKLEAPGKEQVVGQNDRTMFLIQPDGKYIQVYFTMNDQGRIVSYRAYLLNG
ncbi:hypothetical protein KJ951_02860 [Patescibacteria group bacterium]|nr:hypothetical protein [Patescibacteria group bacterium]MBU1703320.1 hypothetical protein [Patescibacteria group bacterium]MBU1953911.1 hypothetical protein [Patescibacteria group bacterium]